MTMTFDIEYAPGEWFGEPTTTDVLVEQFDFGDVSEAALDDMTKHLAIGERITVIAMRGEDGWPMGLRRVS